MNVILIASISLVVIACSIFSFTTFSMFPEITQVYAGKTLNEDDVAQSLQVRMMIEGNAEEITFDSFSRIGYVRSSSPAFLLESLPSKDKEPFYNYLEKSLSTPIPPRLNISIDVYSGDGTLIETLSYRTCVIDSYFLTVNDSKGKFSFLDDSTSDMEIREISKFDCAGFKIII
jgi:hypothetical protein